MSGPEFAAKQGCGMFLSMIWVRQNAGEKAGRALEGVVQCAVVDAEFLSKNEHAGAVEASVALTADLDLEKSYQSCWCAHVIKAFEGLP
eukprot:1155365-Pelagomonas_calceolata.AAC.1